MLARGSLMWEDVRVLGENQHVQAGDHHSTLSHTCTTIAITGIELGSQRWKTSAEVVESDYVLALCTTYKINQIYKLVQKLFKFDIKHWRKNVYRARCIFRKKKIVWQRSQDKVLPFHNWKVCRGDWVT